MLLSPHCLPIALTHLLTSSTQDALALPIVTVQSLIVGRVSRLRGMETQWRYFKPEALLRPELIPFPRGQCSEVYFAGTRNLGETHCYRISLSGKWVTMSWSGCLRPSPIPGLTTRATKVEPASVIEEGWRFADFVLTHRLWLERPDDEIVVLVDGRVVGPL